MKIYIGPYEKDIIPIRKWARACKVDFLTDWLYDLAKLLGPINTLHKKRKVKVHIDPYDIWGLDETLAFIVVPALRLLKEKKQGSPYVDDEDVPEHLRSTAAGPKENEWDTDSLHFARWEWVMDEMIWAFEQHTYEDDAQFHHNIDNIDMQFVKTEGEWSRLKFGSKDPSQPAHYFDTEAYKTHQARKLRGRTLFAKYYEGLWD
jgi:hypothetical protein